MSNRIRKYGKALRGSMIMSLAMVQTLFLLLFMGATVHAHGVHIFAWVEGGTVYNFWNVDWDQNGNWVTAEGIAPWNDILEPGQSTHSLGFCAFR